MQRTGSGLRNPGAGQRVERLSRERPEWAEWLAAYRAALVAGEHANDWVADVRLDDGRDTEAPLLDGAVVVLDRHAVAAAVRTVAGAAGVALPAETGPSDDLPDAGESSDDDLIRAAATGLPARAVDPAGATGNLDTGVTTGNVDTDATGDPRAHSIALLAGAPVRRAIAARVEDRQPPSWGHGHCPVCGAWPTLAEMRGLDRERRLRCGACGADWRRDILRCPYCGERDHEQHRYVAAEGEEETRRIEACLTCSGYVKAVATLSPTPPEELSLVDLETIELDLIALERGFRRPDASGHRATVSVRDSAEAAR